MSASQQEIGSTELAHDVASGMFDKILAMSMSESGDVPAWLVATQQVATAGSDVHKQILEFKEALIKYGKTNGDLEDMADIASFGINDFLSAHELPMLDAMMELRESNGSEAAIAEVKRQATAFQQFISTDPLIRWLDSPPTEIGSSTTIVTTLGGALSALISAL